MLEIINAIYSQIPFVFVFYGSIACVIFYTIIKGQNERIAKTREVESIKAPCLHIFRGY